MILFQYISCKGSFCSTNWPHYLRLDKLLTQYQQSRPAAMSLSHNNCITDIASVECFETNQQSRSFKNGKGWGKEMSFKEVPRDSQRQHVKKQLYCDFNALLEYSDFGFLRDTRDSFFNGSQDLSSRALTLCQTCIFFENI